MYRYLENINTKFIVAIVAFLILMLGLSLLKNDKIEDQQDIVQNDTKIDESDIPYEIIYVDSNDSEKSSVTKDIKKQDELNQVSKDTTKDLISIFNTYDHKNIYNIKLLSNKKIKTTNSSVKYIVVTGDIEDTNQNIPFHLSINENYINSFLELKIKLENDSKTYMCDGNFLNKIDKNNNYHMKIKIIDGNINCFIGFQNIKSKSDKNSDFAMDMNQNIKKVFLKNFNLDGLKISDSNLSDMNNSDNNSSGINLTDNNSTDLNISDNNLSDKNLSDKNSNDLNKSLVFDKVINQKLFK